NPQHPELIVAFRWRAVYKYYYFIIRGGNIMGKTFVCSLCRNGIIGGGLYIDEQSITYSTQKLTVSPLYRNLVLPMNEIRELSWSQMVVPVAAISMKDGECYKFIIYNKSGFEKAYKQYSNHQE
ncbi:hypothetical protein, partial [Faecalibacterium prausnitzii]